MFYFSHHDSSEKYKTSAFAFKTNEPVWSDWEIFKIVCDKISNKSRPNIR